MVKEAYDNGFMDSKNITFNSPAGYSTEWLVEVITNGNSFFLFAPVVVVLIFTSLIFRNIYQIFKSSNTSSPFSDENTKRIKRIGYYAIAIPASKIVMAIIIGIIARFVSYNVSISLSEIVFGLVALCLSQYFAYGAQLQKDVDGLL